MSILLDALTHHDFGRRTQIRSTGSVHDCLKPVVTAWAHHVTAEIGEELIRVELKYVRADASMVDAPQRRLSARGRAAILRDVCSGTAVWDGNVDAVRALHSQLPVEGGELLNSLPKCTAIASCVRIIDCMVDWMNGTILQRVETMWRNGLRERLMRLAPRVCCRLSDDVMDEMINGLSDDDPYTRTLCARGLARAGERLRERHAQKLYRCMMRLHLKRDAIDVIAAMGARAGTQLAWLAMSCMDCSQGDTVIAAIRAVRSLRQYVTDWHIAKIVENVRWTGEFLRMGVIVTNGCVLQGIRSEAIWTLAELGDTVPQAAVDLIGESLWDGDVSWPVLTNRTEMLAYSRSLCRLVMRMGRSVQTRIVDGACRCKSATVVADWCFLVVPERLQRADVSRLLGLWRSSGQTGARAVLAVLRRVEEAGLLTRDVLGEVAAEA